MSNTESDNKQIRSIQQSPAHIQKFPSGLFVGRLTQNRRLKKKSRYLMHLFTAILSAVRPVWLLAGCWLLTDADAGRTQTLPQTGAACSTCFLSARLRSYWLPPFCPPFLYSISSRLPAFISFPPSSLKTKTQS